MAKHESLFAAVPRGLRCRLFRHPWRWSSNRLYLIRGVSFKVCEKDGCRRG